MAENEDINLNVKVKPQGIKETESALGGLSDKLKEIAKAALALFAIDKLVEFAKKSIEAFSESQKAAEDLKFAVMSINGESEKSFTALIANAKKLSASLNNVYSAKQITQAQTQLATYGLTEKQIAKLTPQILDYAAATGKSLPEATEIAIKGINGNAKALKTSGIIIKDTHDATKNFIQLQEQLGKFSGKAASEINTQAGQTATLSNNMEDLESSVGKFIASTGLTKWLGKVAESMAKILRTGDEIRAEVDEASAALASKGDIQQIGDEVENYTNRLKTNTKLSEKEIKKATETFIKNEFTRLKASDETITAVSKKYGIAIKKDNEKVNVDLAKSEKTKVKTIKQIREEEFKELEKQEKIDINRSKKNTAERLDYEKNALEEALGFQIKYAKDLGLNEKDIQLLKDETAEKQIELDKNYSDFIEEQSKKDKTKADKDSEQTLRSLEKLEKEKILATKDNTKERVTAEETAMDSILAYQIKNAELLGLTEENITALKEDNVIKRKQLESDLTAYVLEQSQKKLKDFSAYTSKVAEMQTQMFDSISALTDAFSGKSKKAAKEAFDIQKGLSLASAIVSGIEATVKALSAPPGPPFSIPYAVAAAAMAVANVAKIESTQFDPGTSTSSNRPSTSYSPTSSSYSQGFSTQSLYKPGSNTSNIFGGVPGSGGGGNEGGSGNNSSGGQVVKAYVTAGDIDNAVNKSAVLSRRSKY